MARTQLRISHFTQIFTQENSDNSQSPNSSPCWFNLYTSSWFKKCHINNWLSCQLSCCIRLLVCAKLCENQTNGFQKTFYWNILDSGVTPISKVDFHNVIVFLTHENMGIDTEIEYLTSSIFMLHPIYRYWIMAASGHYGLCKWARSA